MKEIKSKSNALTEIKKLTTVGLGIPKSGTVFNGEINTNSAILLMKNCIVQLESRLAQLELQIAEKKGLVEPD